tara:strand:+ start:404 stop:1342 length:939 start_codon:yes stop_codon:yes gene_type:complete
MSQESNLIYDLITILGPTATGKTQLAVHIANHLNGEIISADSRQVYRGMNIGTGKDLEEYNINGHKIPCHLIDIVEPMQKYNVSQFQKDFQKVATDIDNRGKVPIICGGTGFYIKALLMNFQIPKTEPNKQLRDKLETWNIDELIRKLESISPGASEKWPVDTRRRVIRAIEIALSREKGERRLEKGERDGKEFQNPIIIGIDFPRDEIRKRITRRLYQRLDDGMIEEVESLLKNGVTPERMDDLGLEYRFINSYLQGQIGKNDMIEKLNTAIHQFAKKQMTFFRNMENNGINIIWVPQGDFHIALEVILKT